MSLSWYAKRLAAMGPGEVAQRLIDRFHEAQWRWRYFAKGVRPATPESERHFIGALSRARAADAPDGPRENLLRAADRLLAGEWRTFAITRSDVTPAVDWHLDPKTRSRAPADSYAFDIPFVGGAAPFDTKYVWELSRHHQTTLLAMAFWLTGEDRYARAAADLTQSWARANPFLAGIHWASGIELGMRLIAFTWTRRLLADWPDVAAHFENNETFARAIIQHQWLLVHRHSHGSSANNHLIYEMAGLYVSACAMPWVAQSEAWRNHAAHVLEREFPKQIFPEGYTRELASDYNGFVLEALIICLSEGALGDAPLDARIPDCARRMLEWLAANTDCRGHPPRQGDSDDANGLLLDAPGYDRWRDLLYLHDAWFGDSPPESSSLRAWLLAPLAEPQLSPSRKRRPGTPSSPDGSSCRVPASAGMTKKREACESGLVILRAREKTPSEIWCAFDAGPLGYLSIAAHGHADALSLELRYGGAPVLIDPGTFAYSGPWRDWFRSTAAHNTIEFGGLDQSESGGPFLWMRHARTVLLEAAAGLPDDPSRVRAEAGQDGYVRQSFRGRHRRSVALDREAATLTICDVLNAARPVPFRLSWHLHPDIGCRLAGNSADLVCGSVVLGLVLPGAIAWRVVRGSDGIGPGWYSGSFDVKCPTTTLIGEGTLGEPLVLKTVIRFPVS